MATEQVKTTYETHPCCVRLIDANKIGRVKDFGSLVLAFTSWFKLSLLGDPHNNQANQKMALKISNHIFLNKIAM